LLTTHALASALRAKGIQWGISSISNPDISWVRNWFITQWYDCLPQYTHILMIDDDIGFMPDVVLDMLAFGEPVVGAIYPKKTPTRQWAVSGIERPEIRGPFIEVEGLGAGCFLIRRDAMATMLERLPEIIDRRPNSIDSDMFREAGVKRFLRPFDCINDPDRGTVSEDISFGRRWRMCGGKVWGATHHKMVHVGPHEYADTYAEWAEKAKVQHAADLAAKLANAPILTENPVLRGKACKHGMFVYNPNDTLIGRSMEWYGEWCEFELDLIRKFVKTGDTVIDAGANIGTHTVALSRMVGNEGKVFSFEAQPKLEKILAANIQINELRNVFWDNKAVGAAVSKIALPPFPDEAEAHNFGAYEIMSNATGTTEDIIDLVTIDSFAADGDAFGVSPSLIKIDVEGMELDVIRGAIGTIERCKPVLYFEVGDRSDNTDVMQVLTDIGYVAFWHMGPFFNPINAFQNPANAWPDNRVLAANLVAFPTTFESKSEAYGGVPLEFNLTRFIGPDDTWRKAMERMAQQDTEQRQQAAE